MWFKRFSVVMFVQTINSTLVNYIIKRSALLSDNGKFGLTLYGFGRILSDVRPLYPPLPYSVKMLFGYCNLCLYMLDDMEKGISVPYSCTGPCVVQTHTHLTLHLYAHELRGLDCGVVQQHVKSLPTPL